MAINKAPLQVGLSEAGTDRSGIVQYATDAQTVAASRTDRVITASNLAAMTATNLSALSASDAEAQAKTSSAKFLTPANLAADGFLQSAEVTLTNSEIKNLAATPVEIVAAPGAGKVVMFRLCWLKLNYGGTNAFTEAGDNMQINFTDGSGVRVSSIIECTGFIDQTADTYTAAVPIGNSIAAATGAENQSLVIWNNNAEFAGNAANDNTMTVKVLYNIIEI